MAENSKIEWCHSTFNPWIGCQKVSAGCKNCYAEAMMDGRYGRDAWGPTGMRQRTSEAYWRKPLVWNKECFFCETCGQWMAESKATNHPVKGDRGAAYRKCEGIAKFLRRRVFCASLADVFEDHEALVPWRLDLFDLIRQTPNLDWLLLTKRPENIHRMITEQIKSLDNERISLKRWLYNWAVVDQGAPKNVWLGTSVEDQPTADTRISELAKVPAIVRFLSLEPLLGEVTLSPWIPAGAYLSTAGSAFEHMGAETAARAVYMARCEIPFHWVIVGGESGPGARPMHPDYARFLRDQCADAGVPFLFKQWGSHEVVYDRDRDDPDWRRVEEIERQTPKGQWLNLAGGHGFHGNRVVRVNPVDKHKAGRLLDGREHNEFPEVKAHAV